MTWDEIELLAALRERADAWVRRIHIVEDFVESAWPRRRAKLRIPLWFQRKPEFRRQWAANARARRKRAGLCIACGLVPPREGRARCWVCSSVQNAARTRKRAEARREAPMSESFAETQVRIHLERTTAELFMAVREACQLRCPLTLICFDYGDGKADPFSNVAFKTSLDRQSLVRTAEALLDSWAAESPRMATVEDWKALRLPDSDGVRAAADFCRDRLSGGVGFAIIFGVLNVSSYVASGDREGVAGTLKELLEHWRTG